MHIKILVQNDQNFTEELELAFNQEKCIARRERQCKADVNHIVN